MANRFLVWVGAGAITTGMAAAMVAGAGAAAADNPAGPDVKGTTASDSTKPVDNQQDSGTDDKPKPKPKPKPSDKTPKPGADTEPAASKGDDNKTSGDAKDADTPKVDPDETTVTTGPAGVEPAEADVTGADLVATDPADKFDQSLAKPRPTAPKPTEPKPAPKLAVKQQADEPKPQASVEATVKGTLDTVTPTLLSARIAATTPAVTPDVPETAAVAFAAPSTADITSTAAAGPLTPLLNFIGTVVFNLFAFVTRVVGGPPILPPNSNVSVTVSTLHIDCATGYDVEADWYVPTTGPAPTQLIYLQHGFLAQGPWYSYTAATLAEQTHSIVVAPSLTSNFLACDACWLGAPRMQEAIANLFETGNTALADSLAATGYAGALPDRVVLVGHSLGGGLVAGTAGYMVDNKSISRLAGVVMLDGVGLDDSMTDSLKKVDATIPIYQLGAPEYFWNQFGVGSHALLDARPGQFVGVTLAGGSHVDSMQGGNPLIQFGQELVAGFTLPQNVAAAKILMVGWIKDMFAGPDDQGIYSDPFVPGEQILIDTPAGQATAVALPNDLTKPFLLNFLQPFVALGMGIFTFEPTCGVDPSAAAAAATCSAPAAVNAA